MSAFSTNRTPCRYFQQGRCNKGSNCKFAHVYSNGSGGTAQGTSQSMSEAELLKSFINPSSLPKIAKTINNDMKDAESFQLKPISSSYSYGSPCAVNLISGRDYSPEESRLDYYNAQRQGAIPQYTTQIEAKESDMQECMNFTKAHTDWAARYLQVNTKQLAETGRKSIENEFINFPLDLTGARNKSGSFGANPFTSAPSLNSGSTGGAFGQPAFGQRASSTTSSGFGASSFGSSAFGGNKATGGAFGQPAFGNTSSLGGSFGSSGSAFGKAAFGGAPASGGSAFGKPAFGSTSTPSSSNGSAFGKPAFGATSTPPASGGSAFGKPSFGTGSGAFGQSAFGAGTQQQQQQQPSSAASVFGQPSFGNKTAAAPSATGSSPFGQPSFGSQTGTSSTFGKPTFGSTSGASGTSAFGQSNFKSSPFGAAANNNVAQNTSPFGASAAAANPLGKTGSAPFGSAPSTSNSPFASLQTKPSAFGQPTFGTQAQTPSSPFGAAQKPSNAPFGAAAQQPSTTPFGSSAASKPSPFSSIANQQVSQPTPPKFIQGLPTEEHKLSAKELDQETLRQFQMDHFNLGEVPDIPPPLELIA